MMFAMNAFSTVFLSIMLIASGELVTFFAFIASYPFVLREVILFAVAGAFGQVRLGTIADMKGSLFPVSILYSKR